MAIDPLNPGDKLDEMRRREAAARRKKASRLDPPFPYVMESFDPGFFPIPANPTPAPPPPEAEEGEEDQSPPE